MQAPAQQPCDRLRHNSRENQVILFGASVRSAAQSAAQAGFCVIGIDRFADQDTAQACYRLYQLDQESELGAILDAHPGVPVVQVGGLSGQSAALEQRAAQGNPVFPCVEASRRLADPKLLRRLAAHSGWQFPVTIDHDVLEAGYLPNPQVRWLRKPLDGSGGMGVRWCDAANEIPADDEVFQRWIAGKNYGATLLLDRHRAHLLGLCRSTFHRSKSQLADFPFVYSGSLGPLPCPPQWKESLIELGQQILATTGLRGLCNIDFIVDREGDRWLIEANPRWSGSSELVQMSLLE